MMRLDPVNIFKVILGIIIVINVVVQGHMLGGDFSSASILSRHNKLNTSRIHVSQPESRREDKPKKKTSLKRNLESPP